MKNKIFKIGLFFIIVLFIYNIKIFAVESGSIRMKITGDTAWTNIDVSTAYAECESLNSSTSTLGTTALKAHLTTDADWSAMAIFSISQYGGATSNSPTQTNGNGSGIYEIGTISFSTGILETANSTTTKFITGLFNEDGTVKKYIRQWSMDRTYTDEVWFNETYGYFNSWIFYNILESYPVSVKKGLFGICLGNNNNHVGSYNGGENRPSSGGGHIYISFRPVIWN